MSRLVLFRLFALISSRCADALVESDKLGWTEYRNDRFGLVTRYPAAVFASHRSSASGDGELYETPDGKACSSAPLQIRTTSPRAHIRPLSQGSLILV